MLLFWILLTVVVCFFLYLYMIMPLCVRIVVSERPLLLW